MLRLIATCLLLCAYVCALGTAQPQLPSALVPLDSKKGVGYFAESHMKRPYWQLSRYFTTQHGLTYCGVASSVMVLNALGKVPDVSPTYAPYRLFDQENLFYQRTILNKVVTPTQVHSAGMTLSQLAAILTYEGAKTAVHFGSDIRTVHELRGMLQYAMTHGQYVIVNYDRQALGQVGHGHFSPVAAYHESTDRWLVLDVARYKYPPVWVTTAALWHAMRGVDVGSHKSRGLVIVSH